MNEAKFPFHLPSTNINWLTTADRASAIDYCTIWTVWVYLSQIVYYIFNSLKSEDQSRKKPKDPPPVIEGIYCIISVNSIIYYLQI